MDSAILYANQVIDYCEQSGDKNNKGHAYYAIAYAYDVAGQLENALINYEKARAVFEQVSDTIEVA